MADTGQTIEQRVSFPPPTSSAPSPQCSVASPDSNTHGHHHLLPHPSSNNNKNDGGGDPPISGGFPPPPHPKEEFPSPPSSNAQFVGGNGGPDSGHDGLTDMDAELEGEGFTLSRLLGAEPSPNPSWDCLSLGNSATPPAPSQSSMDGPSGLDTPPTSQTGLDTPPTPQQAAGFDPSPLETGEGVEFETSQERVSSLGYETPPSVSQSYDSCITTSISGFAADTLYSSGHHTITTTSNITTSGGSSPIDHPSSSPHNQVPSGYRPWEAEQQEENQHHHNQHQHHQYSQQQQNSFQHHQGPYNGQGHQNAQQQQQPNQTIPTSQQQQQQPVIRPIPTVGSSGQMNKPQNGHTTTGHQNGHQNLPSFRCEFPYSDLVPPPNTQAPPSNPIPPSSRSTVTHMTGRYTVVHGSMPGVGGVNGQQPTVSAVVPHPQHHNFQHSEMLQYNSGISPNKFPQGRVIAKARRPSQHLGGGVLSPGGPPFSPSTHSDLLRPASASSLTEGSTTSTLNPPTPNPTSPHSQGGAGTPHYTLLSSVEASRSKSGRATSLEGSESSDRSQRSDSADANMSGMSGDCGQVAAISSTDTSTPETLSGLADVFKPPSDIGLGSPTHMGSGGGQMGMGSNSMPADTQEKPAKKKRKRCGDCIGCARKDNCGDCAPCRNNKSHQICKMRRCEALTEKKVKPRKSSSVTNIGDLPMSGTGGVGRASKKAATATAIVTTAAGNNNTTAAAVQPPTSNAAGNAWNPQVTAGTANVLDPWGLDQPNAANQTIAQQVNPPNMGPPSAATLPAAVSLPPISTAISHAPVSTAITTLTFDTAYNFSGPSVTHNSVLNEFFPHHQPQDPYRNLGGGGYQTTGYSHLPAQHHQPVYHHVVPGVHNIQGGYTTGFKSHHHINANHRVTSTGYPGLPSPHHQPMTSPHLSLPSPHHQIPSPHHQPLLSPHHQPLHSPHHQPLPSPHHQPLQSSHYQPTPSPRPYGNPTPSPGGGQSALPSPAQSKQGTPLPSPAAPVNDEYQVTSTRSPGSGNTPRPQQQQQQNHQNIDKSRHYNGGGNTGLMGHQEMPVYTLLPPASILQPDPQSMQYHGSAATQKYPPLYGQDNSFLQLNFQ